MRTQTALTNDELRAVAPSIFAEAPWHAMSARYTFIPTIKVIDEMRDNGFQPFYAAQSRTRIEGKGEFTKHLIRFRDIRHGDSPALAHLGGLFPEVVLTNAHDGASAYKLNAGVFRCVCINGLVAGDSYSQLNVQHRGAVEGVMNATFELVNDFPKLMAQAETFGQLQIAAPQAEVFATAALSLRYDEEHPAPVAASQILRPKRMADTAPNLFNTFNVIQEHLVNGGARGVNPRTLRRVKVRAVSGLSENTRLNKALWTLTERMSELLKAA